MLNYNIYPMKMFAGVMAGFVSVCTEELKPLFIAVLVFEAVDFVTGVIKSAVLAKREGRKFAFESVKCWRTIYKVVFLLIGVALMEYLDRILMVEGRLRFANYFTAFCCGVEFWSFLENAAEVCDHPIFRYLKRFMKTKVEDQIGGKFDEKEQSHETTDRTQMA